MSNTPDDGAYGIPPAGQPSPGSPAPSAPCAQPHAAQQPAPSAPQAAPRAQAAQQTGWKAPAAAFQQQAGPASAGYGAQPVGAPTGFPVQPAPGVGQQAPVPPQPFPPSAQPAYPSEPSVAQPDYGKIGGALLAFIILQAVHAFLMVSGFPDALENFLGNLITRPHAFGAAGTLLESAASLVAMVTLVVYAVFIIMALVQLITRNSSFLRFFQLAGIVAVAGNLVVFILKEVLDIALMYEGYVPNVGYHWMLAMLALLWTIFWTLYFVRSVRMRCFMSPSNPYTLEQGVPYIEKALFGSGMKG